MRSRFSDPTCAESAGGAEVSEVQSGQIGRNPEATVSRSPLKGFVKPT